MANGISLMNATSWTGYRIMPDQPASATAPKVPQTEAVLPGCYQMLITGSGRSEWTVGARAYGTRGDLMDCHQVTLPKGYYVCSSAAG